MQHRRFTSRLRLHPIEVLEQASVAGSTPHSEGSRISDAAAATVSEPRFRFEIWENDLGHRWDSLVSSFSDASLEQMAAYVEPRWGHSRLCGLLVRCVDTGEPIALALVILVTIPFIKLGMAYLKFGPLWRRTSAPLDPTILAAALDAAKQAFVVERGLVLRIMPPPDPDYEETWQQALTTAGFANSGPPPDPERYLVDLRLTESEQRASLDSKWRSNLNKAIASGLDFREVEPVQSVPEFLALYRTMMARKQFSDRHHIELLPQFVAAAAATPGLGVRMFLAYEKGRAVAGTIIAGSGERVLVPFSASDDRAQSLRAGYALRWWIVNQLRGTTARWLDLGGTEGDAGLRSFKTGNIGKRGRIARIAGEYDYSQSALSRIVSTAMTSSHRLVQGWPARFKRA
ncbi:MAG: peptidoglycan bridge formation glycyltransferase FemA/FemB family protein [Rhizobiales bacterium]|nr:peptidoglycan bridge formation glycyltransferase FemA/FemB family protein [Hyphomicrobiales bacterium]